MGLFGGRTCSVYPTTVYVDAPNPDPAKFNILQTDDVGKHCVAKIGYPDCTNFEGIKICVYMNMSGDRLRKLSRLDPHFTDDGSISPIARFKPTAKGHMLALMFCSELLRGNV